MSQSPADTIAEMCYLNTGFILVLNIICITCLLNISVTVIFNSVFKKQTRIVLMKIILNYMLNQ